MNLIPGILDTDVFAEYIKLSSPLFTGLDGRIEMVDNSDCFTSTGSKLSSSFLVVVMIFNVMILISTSIGT